jgi:hypothetical protein
VHVPWGISRLTGERSSLSTKSIIAIKGAAELVRSQGEPHLTNHALYRRDRHVCGYCGGQYKDYDLSGIMSSPCIRVGVTVG